MLKQWTDGAVEAWSAPGADLHEEAIDHCDDILRRLPWPPGECLRPVRTLGITTCARGEGASTVAAHLAAAAASYPRQRILLVDCNLAAPAAARIFSMAPAPGLVECLMEGDEVAGAIQPSPVTNLWVLPAGRLRTSPARAYESPQLAPLMKELAGQFDLVVFDLPAAGRASCVYRVAGLLDGVLLVMEAERATWDAALRVKELLLRAGARLLGAALNKSRDRLPCWLDADPRGDDEDVSLTRLE